MSVSQWEYNILVEKNTQLKTELENYKNSNPAEYFVRLNNLLDTAEKSNTIKDLQQKVKHKDEVIKELSKKYQNIELRLKDNKRWIKSAKKEMSIFEDVLGKIKDDLEKGVDVSEIITAIDELLQSSEASKVIEVETDECCNSNDELMSDCEVVHETRTTPDKKATEAVFPNDAAPEQLVASRKELQTTWERLLQNKEASIRLNDDSDEDIIVSSVITPIDKNASVTTVRLSQAKQAANVNDASVTTESDQLSPTHASTSCDTNRHKRRDCVTDQVAKNKLQPVAHIVLNDDNIDIKEIIDSVGKTAKKAFVNDRGKTDRAVKKKHFQNYSDVLEILLEDTDHSGQEITASNNEGGLDDRTNEQKDSDVIEILLEENDHSGQDIIASNKEDGLNNVMNNIDINKQKDSENPLKVNKRKKTDSRIDIHRKKVKRSIYSCFLCCKSFYNKYGLNKHYKTHDKEKLFACDKCDKCFIKKEDLIIHEKWHIGDNLQEENPEEIDPNDIGTVEDENINDVTIESNNKSKKGKLRLKSLVNLTEQPSVSEEIIVLEGIQTNNQKSQIGMNEIMTADGPEKEDLAATKSLEITQRSELNLHKSLDHPQIVLQPVVVSVMKPVSALVLQSPPVLTKPKPPEVLLEHLVPSEPPVLEKEVSDVRLNSENNDNLVIVDSFSCAETLPDNFVFLEKKQETEANPTQSQSGSNTQPSNNTDNYIIITPNNTNTNGDNQSAINKETSINPPQSKQTATYSPALKSEIVRMVTEELLSPSSIKKKYGISAHTVRDWVKREGKKLPLAERYKNNPRAIRPK